jgi:hypothetical protein
MNSKEPGAVEVSLNKDLVNGKYFFGIELRSGISPRHISKHPIDPAASQGTGNSMEYLIATGAAALAEHQNEQHGDQHDPDEVSVRAVEAFRELCSDLRQQGTI